LEDPDEESSGWEAALPRLDDAAGVVGGLSVAPSGDVSETHGVFQPSHGSAPDIAGKGVANPVATILSVNETVHRQHLHGHTLAFQLPQRLRADLEHPEHAGREDDRCCPVLDQWMRGSWRMPVSPQSRRGRRPDRAWRPPRPTICAAYRSSTVSRPRWTPSSVETLRIASSAPST
jgi:hypothetical protein